VGSNPTPSALDLVIRATRVDPVGWAEGPWPRRRARCQLPQGVLPELIMANTATSEFLIGSDRYVDG
jgi:hypothetical protein